VNVQNQVAQSHGLEFPKASCYEGTAGGICCLTEKGEYILADACSKPAA